MPPFRFRPLTEPRAEQAVCLFVLARVSAPGPLRLPMPVDER
jgi:hypothetical protein